MKTTFALLSLAAWLPAARAQDEVAIPTDDSTYYVMPAVVYEAEVVYQAPVVYEGTVVYLGPVFYQAAPAQPACPPRNCSLASTVIYIGGGVSSQTFTTCRNSRSSVVYFGGGQGALHGYNFSSYR